MRKLTNHHKIYANPSISTRAVNRVNPIGLRVNRVLGFYNFTRNLTLLRFGFIGFGLVGFRVNQVSLVRLVGLLIVKP